MQENNKRQIITNPVITIPSGILYDRSMKQVNIELKREGRE